MFGKGGSVFSAAAVSYVRSKESSLLLNISMNLTQKRNAKDIRFGSDARQLMLQGVDLLADAVGLTLGPKVLARAIAKEGINVIDRGANPIEIRKGILMAVDAVQNHLLTMSRPVSTHEEILQVATISANGDRGIGELIASAMQKVGKTGVILVNEGTVAYDKIDLIQGMQFDSGYISPYFINVEKEKKVHFKNALIVFSNEKISQINPLLNALDLALKKKRPLVIVADDVEGDALTTLVINKLDRGLPVCAIKSPSYGEGRIESLRDMAVATGGTVFDDEAGISLEEITEEHLGEAAEVIITKNDTIFLKGKGRKQLIEKRLQMIDYLKERATYDALKENLDERKGRLTSGVAIINVGGQSEFDRGERKDRVTDALNATKAAVEEGIVAGGGTALIRCRDIIDYIKPENSDQCLGIRVVKNSLHVPCYTIAENAGVNGSLVAETVSFESGDVGYDAINDRYVDMFDVGIIDPTKVVRTALGDAASVASLLTTAEAVITIKPVDKQEAKKSEPLPEADFDEEEELETEYSYKMN
ncbi:hypothetical protein O3M35_005967 [Rhynocoris fuscipes]|uniref:60 kDa chaperonin n=1 Tax=Rhynocoris fuscipes TaxID=488301 RepID=A0AAW1DC78_9HEMI